MLFDDVITFDSSEKVGIPGLHSTWGPRVASKPSTNAANDADHRDANDLVNDLVTNELVFGVVGAVGSGTSEIASALSDFLEESGYDVHIIKARRLIENFARAKGLAIPAAKSIEQTISLQDAGDEMRKEHGHSAIAESFAVEIRSTRAKRLGMVPIASQPVQPDKVRRAYILDSIRHPTEVLLLRKVYQQAFCVIGVVCEEDVRQTRLSDKYEDASKLKIKELMKRDEKASEKHGQQVASAFHLSDFFVENTESRFIRAAGGAEEPNPSWTVSDELGRLVDILALNKIVRPRPNETAMYHAHGARMRSSCLSRQVGAALLDRRGNLLATGTNEVPRAGGGVYGGAFDGFSDVDPDPANDHRCFCMADIAETQRRRIRLSMILHNL